MAISDLLPRKASESKTRVQTLGGRLKYDQKEEKTKDGELVSAYMCCPETAAEEFEMGKLIYESSTGTQTKTKRKAPAGNASLLVDIQAKMQAGKGKGYERWAKVFNLKEAAKTLNFLVENGVTDYEELAARAGAAGEKFDSLSVRLKQLEGRLSQNAGNL